MKRRSTLELIRQKTLVCTLVVTGISTTFAQAPQKDDRGSLAWFAQQASKNGKTFVTLPQPDILVAEVEPLSEALQHTTAVVAQLIATDTNHDDYQIFTWRKYRILERLSNQPVIPLDRLPNDVPRSLFPLAADEFVMAEIGGTVDVNGVRVTMQGPKGYVPPDQIRHLMFLMLFASGSMAGSNYGPEGVFWVDGADVIHARVESDTNLLGSDLVNRTSRRLSALRILSPRASR